MGYGMGAAAGALEEAMKHHAAGRAVLIEAVIDKDETVSIVNNKND
ncbi:MAG: hypothetical protein FWC22_06795 [Treponema sp.]|nr:hypothetical protein [Treponema sp.]